MFIDYGKYPMDLISLLLHVYIDSGDYLKSTLSTMINSTAFVGCENIMATFAVLPVASGKPTAARFLRGEYTKEVKMKYFRFRTEECILGPLRVCPILFYGNMSILIF